MAKKKKSSELKKDNYKNNPFKRLKGFAYSAQEKNNPNPTVSEPVQDEVIGSFIDVMRTLGVEQLNKSETFDSEDLESLECGDNILEKDEDLSEAAIFLAAMGDLSVSFEDGFVEEPRPEVLPKRIKQVKQGKLSPDASLDLHGLQCTEVVDKLQNFLHKAEHRGWQTLLVITGKGLHSEDGEPVLRNEVERYLSAEGKKQVIEWSRAPRQYGGNGALFLFLKRR